MKSRDEIRADALLEIDGLLMRHGPDQHALVCYGVLDAALLSLARSQGMLRATEFLYQSADLWAASVPPLAAPLLEKVLERPPRLEMSRLAKFRVWCFRNQIVVGCLYGALIGVCLGVSIAMALR